MDTHQRGGSDAPHGPETSETSEMPETPEAPETPGPTEASHTAAGPRAPQSDVPYPDGSLPVAGPGPVFGSAGSAGSTPASDHGPTPASEPRTGVAALSPRYQIGAAAALAVVAIAVCVHLITVFLHVAPSNTITRTHGAAIDDWVYPEFEQNWKLFAPNPLQQNIAVQVRARIRTPDGGMRTTGWYDLSARDGRAIDSNPVPSHTQQNELRRAWDYFMATHGTDNRPIGLRGSLSETYLRHIVVLRLERIGATADDGVVEQVRIRSRTTNVAPPEWSAEKVAAEPSYRVLPWWSVPDDEADGGAK